MFISVKEILGISRIVLNQNFTKREYLLEVLRSEVYKCQRCALHKTKTYYVFGAGNPYAPLVLIGEAPGQEEDKRGKPFVGRAGELLNSVIKELGYNRERDTYICNVLKCRPPMNRDPLPEEIKACSPFLKSQIDILKPRVIITLGKYARQFVTSMFSHLSGTRIVNTYHPAFVLRKPTMLEKFKEDIKKGIDFLEMG